MEHFKAAASAIVSTGSTVWMWISIQDAQAFAAIFASCVAVISGYFAIRYYFYAAQEKKMSIKQMKNKT